MSEVTPELPEDCEEAKRAVERAVQEIGEHVDSVLIFVTKKRTDGGRGTWHISQGIGNWFAQFGQVSHWLQEQKEIARHEALKGPE